MFKALRSFVRGFRQGVRSPGPRAPEPRIELEYNVTYRVFRGDYGWHWVLVLVYVGGEVREERTTPLSTWLEAHHGVAEAINRVVGEIGAPR